MQFRWPDKYSKEWWLWLANGALFFAVFTVATLYVLGETFSIVELLIFGLLGSVVGDLLMAATIEIAAPTKVTVRLGERRHSNQSTNHNAVVISGFGNTCLGLVEVGGETWNAQISSGQPVSLRPGDRVSIVDRHGLCFMVESIKDT